jgi:FkbM family methyltransferase
MRIRFLHRAYKARFRDQRSEILAALSVIRHGDTAVDVGANKGAYLYWLRRAVGASGKVFAYEPQPALARYLQSVCAAMKWKNVTVLDCALSNSPGVRMLHVPGAGVSPGASLEQAVVEACPSHSYECQVDTLDRQLQNAGRVTFLKVDVEGHELQVFRGSAEILSAHEPVILFECEARHLRQQSMEDVFAFLHGFGYEGAFFSPGGLRPLREFDPKVHQRQDSERFWDAPGYCNNFLFVPRNRPATGALR